MKFLERVIPWILLALVIGGEAAVAQFSGYPPLGYVQIANDSASAPTWQPNPGLLIVNNLADLSNVPAAQSNLGLGNMAQQSSGSVGISGGSITGMPSPTNPTDVANKGYVDAAIAAAISGIPLITSLTPNSGAAGGGTSVAIAGTNFVGSTIVQFGTASAAAFNVNSAISITATSAAGTGTVDVRVTNPTGISSIVMADQFTYAALPPAPAVTSISPTSGGTGASVGLVGTNFTGATAVKFGATNATSFTVNSVSSITTVAPAGTGTVDITVTTPSGTSPTSAADQFTYTSNCDTSTGGSISVSGGKRIHVFASSGTFVASGSCTATYAVIGGGCAGGNTANSAGNGAGGGGGGGNVLTGTFPASAHSYAISVGGACASSSISGEVTAGPGTVGQNAFAPAGGGNGGSSGASFSGGFGNSTAGGAGGGAGAGGPGFSVSSNVGAAGGGGVSISVPGLSGVFGGGGGGGGTTNGAGGSGGGGSGGSQGDNGNGGFAYGAGGGGATAG